LGIELELPVNWGIDNLREAEEYSQSNPDEMILRFRSGQDSINLSATALAAFEKLPHVFDISLKGAMDGGRLTAVGGQVKETRDGVEILSQKLGRTAKSGPQLAVFLGFFSRGYFISILHIGPAGTEEDREEILKRLHILQKPAH
jgi:hypothetical protein